MKKHLFFATTILALLASVLGCSGDNHTFTTPQPVPASIVISPNSSLQAPLTIRKGSTLPLTAKVLPEGTKTQVVWESSLPTKATVSPAMGDEVTVSGISGSGDTVIPITAKTVDGGATAFVFVKVLADVETVTITNKAPFPPDPKEIEVGVTIPLLATVGPSDATDKRLIWTSNNPSVASVSNADQPTDQTTTMVTGNSPGVAIIRARSVDGGAEDTCLIQVLPPPPGPPVNVTGVTLHPLSIELAVDGYEDLQAVVSPVDATDKSLTWSSLDTSVARVDQNGRVTGVKVGNTTIRVTTVDQGKSATCAVSVLSHIPVWDVSLSRNALDLAPGNTEALGATVRPNNASDPSLRWESSNTFVATVSNGTITAVAPGTAIITATTTDPETSPARSASCIVTVQSVYIAGNEIRGNISVAKYWINGQPRILNSDITRDADAKSIAVSTFGVNTTVYVAGDEMNTNGVSAAKVWVDGVAYFLGDPSNESKANSVYVSGTDYYVAGYETINGKKVPTVWKNGPANPTRLQPNDLNSGDTVANCIVVHGGYEYVVGYETNRNGFTVPMYWKGGVSYPLTVAGSNASANSVYVAQNNDVWVAGWENNAEGIPMAVLWKNGSREDILPASRRMSVANSVCVAANGEVYVAGFESNGLMPTAIMWRGTTSTSKPLLAPLTLSNGGTESRAYSIFVLSQDAYVVGFENNTSTEPVGRLWKNGFAQSIDSASIAKAVAIK
jgi:uncharacterized protein YjdB